MAEVNVDKKRSEERDRQESRGLQRRHDFGITRERDFFPSSFWRPSEFLTSNPFTLMRRFSDEMDRVFSSAWTGTGTSEVGTWSPAIEVSEREGKVLVHADLPGLNKEDVKIEVVNDNLIIQGERKREHEEEGKGFRRSERSYGSFYRSIPLPEGANVDEARAQFNNGVLEVSIPVPAEQRKTRQVPIETGTTERIEAKSASAGQQRESKTG